MSKPRILFSIPSRSHVEIAVDELTGMADLGYTCSGFSFAGREGAGSGLARIWVILVNAIALVKKAHSFKPDIIYFNSRLEVKPLIRDSLTIWILKIFYSGKVRFLIKSHGSDPEVLDSNSFAIRKIALPYLRKTVSGWLFLSTEEKETVNSAAYFKAGSIFTTKNIVRTGQFKHDPAFRSRFNIPEGHKILLFTGRIIREKGIYEVVEAFAKIKDQHKVTLIIVGDGHDYEKIKQLITSAGLAKDVILTGFIPEPEVVEFYSNSDILVFPTYFPEGFPMALFNSVGAGLAVITTPTRAAVDFLTAPENCLWAEAKNSENLHAGLNKLLSSEALMAAMRKNNLIKSRLFSKAQVADELATTINNIINK